MKDNFSQQASGYAQYRPQYPEELFAYILRFVKEKKLAWDCGTGNGQSAKALSNYFEKVIATDISQKQIDNAYKASNIFYAVEPAEQTTLADKSVDLITVAQAMHWFNFEKFYAEVNRVAKPGAVIAVWTYNLLKISKEIDDLINEY
ncbi:MAG TPA: class I SAM-dependent methyltransferase, partial [Ferruginibacter sp.]|nr:class I SAM-dependent methyltransferase [Ferruginibacter sp.]